MTSGRVPLVLDVDTGLDDALALALAVRTSEADVVAVTTVAGNVDVFQATRNTLAVLDWLGETGIPVHRGASRPLARLHEDAVTDHGTNGIGNAEIPASGRDIGADRGPAALIRLARQRPGELTLVCTGPLTNLAIALNVEPDLPRLLPRVVIMGGAFTVPGNVTPRAEFNCYSDPEATAQVFAARFTEAVVVGLDVTRQVMLPRDAWLASVGSENPVTRLVSDVCRWSFIERGLEQIYLHDPLAVAAAVNANLVSGDRVSMWVDVSDAERGVTRVTGHGRFTVARAVDVPTVLGCVNAALGLEIGVKH